MESDLHFFDWKQIVMSFGTKAGEKLLCKWLVIDSQQIDPKPGAQSTLCLFPALSFTCWYNADTPIHLSLPQFATNLPNKAVWDWLIKNTVRANYYPVILLCSYKFCSQPPSKLWEVTGSLIKVLWLLR